MKKIFLLLTMVISVATANAQSSANYPFITSSSASLTDMSAGTTQLIGPSADDVSSLVTNIGFEFWIMGNRSNKFSVNSNGYVELESNAISNLLSTLGNSIRKYITALGSNLSTGASGKVHYKISGLAPNRVLVIEFKNMSIISPGSSADGTYQVRLYETSNNIELVYGNMNRNSSAGAAQYIGFSVDNTNNKFATYVTGTSTLTTTGPLTSQQYTLNAPITDLTSVADGSRKMFSFLGPNGPVAPSGLNFTAITALGMTLNWTDNSSDEAKFAIYRSDDGGATYNFITYTAANATSFAQTALVPSTNYFWKVYAVRETPSSAATGSQVTNAPGNITSNGTGGGQWYSTSTWAGGVVPTASDNVTIKNGDVVEIDNNASAYNLTIGEGASGTLLFASANPFVGVFLQVEGNVIVSAGGTFSIEFFASNILHNLYIEGSLTNNGTLDFSTNSNTTGVLITFYGADNSYFTGSGPITDIQAISINKVTQANVLELMPANLTVKGVTATGSDFIFLSGGTLKISGTFIMNLLLFDSPGNYSIQETSGIWLNNPNLTVTGQNASLDIKGLLRITQGAFTIGSVADNSLLISPGGTMIVEGGTVNAAGRFGIFDNNSFFTFIQSGGTITVCTAGNTDPLLASFDLGTSVASNINISGGTIICQRAASGVDYRNQAGTGRTAVTGGSLQLGNASSGAAQFFSINGVIPNLILTNTSANHFASLGTTASNFPNSSLNITSNTGTTLDLGDAPFYFYGTLLTNNGTLRHQHPSSGFISSLQTAPQLYTGSGTFGTVSFPTKIMVFDSPTGFTIDPASPNIITEAVALLRGNVTNSNKLTVGYGGSSTAVVLIGHGTVATNAGVFDQPLTYNPGTGGITVFYQLTTSARITGPEIPVTRTVNNMFYYDTDPTHSLTIAGGDLTVSGTLSMVSGNINTGSNTLIVGTSTALPGNLSYTSGTIIGKFKRWINNTTGNRNFPVGISTATRNASINFTTAPSTGGTLTAEWISSPGGTNGLPQNQGAFMVTKTANEGYWRITAGDGLSGGLYTGTFTATAISGITDVTQLALLKRINAATAWFLQGTHVTGSGPVTAPVLSRTGMFNFSDFGIGSSNLNTLPVQFILFNVRCEGNNILINWKTAQEQNSSHFNIERSTDGIRWTVINIQSAAGNSNVEKAYSFSDSNPAQQSFYRIAQYDIDGRVQYTSIIKATCDVSDIVKVWPNPVKETVFVNINTNSRSKAIIKMFDSKGALIKIQNTELLSGSNQVNMDMGKLPVGIYQLVIEWGNSQMNKTIQVVKQ
ncbi:hypothetical protein CAP36_04850 [Chitinophagaceae bacterium IBVUCB2]|nr:hypothetical protein CAP36_04850 [Chitinophagaceae bacterium IBVUCB2]